MFNELSVSLSDRAERQKLFFCELEIHILRELSQKKFNIEKDGPA